MSEELAEGVVAAWEAAEGESMRDGHRHTMVALIAAGIAQAVTPLRAEIIEFEQSFELFRRYAQEERAARLRAESAIVVLQEAGEAGDRVTIPAPVIHALRLIGMPERVRTPEAMGKWLVRLGAEVEAQEADIKGWISLHAQELETSGRAVELARRDGADEMRERAAHWHDERANAGLNNHQVYAAAIRGLPIEGGEGDRAALDETRETMKAAFQGYLIGYVMGMLRLNNPADLVWLSRVLGAQLAKVNAGIEKLGGPWPSVPEEM